VEGSQTELAERAGPEVYAAELPIDSVHRRKPVQETSKKGDRLIPIEPLECLRAAEKG